MTVKRLSEMTPGERGTVEALEGDASVVNQLTELGFGVGEEIFLQGQAPWGDPLVIGLLNYRLALRKKDAARVLVREGSLPT